MHFQNLLLMLAVDASGGSIRVATERERHGLLIVVQGLGPGVPASRTRADLGPVLHYQTTRHGFGFGDRAETHAGSGGSAVLAPAQPTVGARFE